MPRPKGSESAGTAAKRDAMLRAIWTAMRARPEKPLSWREMAAAAAVGPATLAHHFGKREAVLEAIFAHRRAAGAEALTVLATPEADAPGPSLRAALRHLAVGLRDYEVGDILAHGLAEGAGHPALGPAVAGDVLDPVLDALAARIAAHVRAGHLTPGPAPRTDALRLAAPLILAHLHTDHLAGGGLPDLDVLADDLAAQFVAGRTPSA